MDGTFESLHGEITLMAIRMDVRHPFCEDANGAALQLGEKTIFVFEDPSDDYRSCASDPLIVNAPIYSFGCDPDYIRIPVTVQKLEPLESYEESEGIQLIDRRNGKIILRLGTDNSNDYYPCFVSEWVPQNIADNEPT